MSRSKVTKYKIVNAKELRIIIKQEYNLNIEIVSKVKMENVISVNNLISMHILKTDSAEPEKSKVFNKSNL